MTSTPASAPRQAPSPGDLLDDVVAAVCRPSDVPAVRAAVADRDPEDLAALVAAVDSHQPMTLEVVVDVLAELDVPPPAIAAALAIDVEDVLALVARPLAGSRVPRPDPGTRIIEVVAPGQVEAGHADDVEPGSGHVDRSPEDQDPAPEPVGDDADDPPPDGADRPVPDDGEPTVTDDPATPVTDDPATPVTDDVEPTVSADPASTAGEDAKRTEPDNAGETPPVAVRIDEVAEDEAVARTVADLDDEQSGPGRARLLLWILGLLVLIAGGLSVALLWL